MKLAWRENYAQHREDDHTKEKSEYVTIDVT